MSATQTSESNTLHQFALLKSQPVKWATKLKTVADRLALARAFSAAAHEAYWAALCQKLKTNKELTAHGLSLPALPAEMLGLAQTLGTLSSAFPPEQACYLLGGLYTVLLPERIRAETGAWYTPPVLVRRLLELASQSGVDFRDCSVLEPACGSGSILVGTALYMLRHSSRHTTKDILDDLGARLHGVELDPFSAWMSQVHLEATLLPLSVIANWRAPQMVSVKDALSLNETTQYDLIIGNPPWGKVQLDQATRARFARCLHGHANLYGLFTDQALRLARPGGVIAWLTPASFMGGRYFKRLRSLLTSQSAPRAFEFVSQRKGIFEDALQECVLATYHVEGKSAPAQVSLLDPGNTNTAPQTWLAGAVQIPDTGEPWLMPRHPSDMAFVSAALRMRHRLSDYGYRVSTGQLVWNRHKDQFCHSRNRKNTFPLAWAEAVTSEGFAFRASQRNHAPYIELGDQAHLLTTRTCLLCRRTTALEQGQRLMCAVLPQHFIDGHDGVVVENHLNIIHAPDCCLVSAEALATLLNSAPVNRVFQCINGSVAVSAYELEALPLPSIAQVKKLEALLDSNANGQMVHELILSFYSAPAI